MSRIFVETTIQVQRVIADHSVRSVIDNVLQQHETVTSLYVWMEFQRTVGQDYQYLIDLLHRQKPTTDLQLFRYIGEGEGLFSARKIKRLLLTITKFLEQVENARFDAVEFAYLLERERNWLLQHRFFENIDQTLDATSCDLIQPNYTIPPGGRMSCRRATAQCSLVDLLSKHTPAIQKLQADATTLKALDTTTQRALTEITADATMAKGERNCWALGDLIITLECPPDAALWTTNIRHFEPLCTAFGRQLFRPTGVAA